jgi:hypothetical protein
VADINDQICPSVKKVRRFSISETDAMPNLQSMTFTMAPPSMYLPSGGPEHGGAPDESIPRVEFKRAQGGCSTRAALLRLFSSMNSTPAVRKICLIISGRIQRLDGRFGGVRAAIWRRFTGEHNEPVNVISKSHQNRSAFSMTAIITTAKDARLGADT